MINIYSIKEVIEASNNILNRKDNKTGLTSSKKSISKKNFVLTKDKPLVLTDEVSNKSNFRESQKKISNKKLKGNTSIKSIRKNKLIDQLYFKFNKKVKKNTLKLIFELQNELKNLNKLKDTLQLSNHKIKKQINNLNNEFLKINTLNKSLTEDKITLNDKILELSNKLNSSEIEIEKLRRDKLELEKDQKENFILKEKIAKLSENLNSSENEIIKLNQNKAELEKEISNYKIQEEVSSKKIYDVSEVENKNKFFQEENLRIGSELLEVKKKHDILKKEIEKYENQKSNLISKINSVNEALNDTNILTNVFENKVENKVKVIDHNKIETKISSDLDEQIHKIFSDKN